MATVVDVLVNGQVTFLRASTSLYLEGTVRLQQMKLFMLFITLLSNVLLCGEFPSVLVERNLEKRSELALKLAGEMITGAKTAYDASKFEEFRKRVTEVVELVDLSYKSLIDSGKRARNKPKYWKRAELQLRTLTRQLDGLAADVVSEDRDVVTLAVSTLAVCTIRCCTTS